MVPWSMPEATRCNACHSESTAKFAAEIAIHFSGQENIDRPHVFVFPELVVCLICGVAEFAVPEAELGALAKREAAGAE